MNMDKLTPAQTKAIETGGTRNAVIGVSLVKRGIFEKTENGTFPFMPTAEFLNWESSLNASPHIVEVIDAKAEKEYQDAITAEEDASSTSEAWELAEMERQDNEREITALRDEFPHADDDRREEILGRLAVLGTVVYSEGTPEHTVYAEEVREALANWCGTDVTVGGRIGGGKTVIPPTDLGDLPRVLDEIVPPVIVRDPNEKRYSHIQNWTDENLDIKRGILDGRLRRRTLLKGDRLQAERHAGIVNAEIERRASA